MGSLTDSIQFIKGVGPALAQRFEKLGVYKIRDLIYFFPRTYEDRRSLPNISQLRVSEQVVFIAAISSVTTTQTSRKKTMLVCQMSDKSGSISATWFNQGYLKKTFKVGMMLVIRGKVETHYQTNQRFVQVSDFEHWDPKSDAQKRIMPIYHLTHGLYQNKVRDTVKVALKESLNLLCDPVPQSLLQTYQLPTLNEAIWSLHYPETLQDIQLARARVVFEEFLVYQLQLLSYRSQAETRSTSIPLITSGSLVQDYVKSLPYTLTKAQQNAVKDIEADIQKPVTMNRLLQGDVGSGKTDVAIISLLSAVETGLNGALMAPTEILAEQHYTKLSKHLNKLGIDVMLLKSKMKKKEKDQVLEKLMDNDPSIVVGTHALIQDKVSMKNLGLIVVDEQHRFGVMQRVRLSQKGENPHSLFMTATPIPRSFMLTCFGDLDKTIIDEMPPGRIPPKTYFIKQPSIYKLYQKCDEILSQNQQIYIVYPLIEESEHLDLNNAVQGFETIQSRFPQAKVGLLHGRLSPDEKKRIMDEFSQNKSQILVSTTVIEVGIDVPNATVMIIMDSERFGLSQLHQLRGRVGRGGNESFCFLVGKPANPDANKRLKSILSTTDGFKLAEYDLLIRGPGDILGTKQSGLPPFVLGDIVKDESILIRARKVAKEIIEKDPLLERPENKRLKDALISAQSSVQSNPLN